MDFFHPYPYIFGVNSHHTYIGTYLRNDPWCKYFCLSFKPLYGLCPGSATQMAAMMQEEGGKKRLDI